MSNRIEYTTGRTVTLDPRPAQGVIPAALDLSTDGLTLRVEGDLEAFAVKVAQAVASLIGTWPPDPRVPCEECDGTGERTYNADPERDSFDGPVMIDCETCAGSGQVES